MSICKTIVRWTLISGIAVGGIVLVFGPGRVVAAVDTMQERAGAFVDQYIDVEEARELRSRLHELASVYPERIAEIRGELARVQTQVAQFEHDADVARRVVAMTAADLERIAANVDSAERTGITTVSLVAGDAGVDIDVAYREGRRIQGVRKTYQERLVADCQQLEMLTAQHGRLQTLLEQVEGEFTEYQSQVWQLDRQIDAIERNNRLIALTESQQQTLQRFNTPGDTESLRTIEARLAEISAVQEGTLQSLHEQQRQGEYEHRARSMMVDPEGVSSPNPFAEFLPKTRLEFPSTEAATPAAPDTPDTPRRELARAATTPS
ncbi:MAG: hypothetical protein QF733_05625 [Phycisphaerales bacterium]|nr:hypothetical protein [Phycisphaerales bacterium]